MSSHNSNNDSNDNNSNDSSQHAGAHPLSAEDLDHSTKRTALAGQWRTPPLPVFAAGMKQQQQQQQQHVQAQVPAIPQDQVKVNELPGNAEDYAKALQEAYLRGAQAAAAMAAGGSALSQAASCPNLIQVRHPLQAQQQAQAQQAHGSPSQAHSHSHSHAQAAVEISVQDLAIAMPILPTPSNLNSNSNTKSSSVPNPLEMMDTSGTNDSDNDNDDNSSGNNSSNNSHKVMPPPSLKVMSPPSQPALPRRVQVAQGQPTNITASTTMNLAIASAASSQHQQLSQHQQQQLSQQQQQQQQQLSQQQQQHQHQQRSISLPDMTTYAAAQEAEKRQKRLARNRASARLRRLRKKNLVDAYETEVGILEKTLQQLQAHEWGAQDNASALTEALSMDRGQQVLDRASRQQAAHDILEQQLELMDQLQDMMHEQYVLQQLATNNSKEFEDLKQALQLSDEQLQQLSAQQSGWAEEWAALQTVKASLLAMKENDWLSNEGCSNAAETMLAILHKNQVSKFLLWADHNAEAIDEIDSVNAASAVPAGPVFGFGVESNADGFAGDE